jgi:nucleoid-associated protein YgaU
VADAPDDTAPEGDAGSHAGKAGGLLHGKHATEIMVVCGIATVVLGYLTFHKSSAPQTAAAAGAQPGAASGNVAGFDAASVQGLSDQLQTMSQADAGAFQSMSDAIGAQTKAQQQAAAGLQTAIGNQQGAIANLTKTISTLPQRLTPRTPPPIIHPAPANPGPVGRESYVVRPHDTLSGIAARYPSPAITWQSLARVNGIGNPDLIHPGQRLQIG